MFIYYVEEDFREKMRRVFIRSVVSSLVFSLFPKMHVQPPLIHVVSFSAGFHPVKTWRCNKKNHISGCINALERVERTEQIRIKLYEKWF